MVAVEREAGQGSSVCGQMTRSRRRGAGAIFLCGCLVGVFASIFVILAPWPRRGDGDGEDAVRRAASGFERTIKSTAHETLVPREMRVLLYFTTFPKHQHLVMMRSCWPSLLSAGKLLHSADVLVFLGGEAEPDTIAQWKAEVQKLAANATVVHDSWNPGHQLGAMRAMHLLMKNSWWKGYDWVIRLNPDVLIYDDTWIDIFFRDEKLSAVLANCQANLMKSVGHVHTDFFAMRPDRIPENSFADWETARHAETQATKEFTEIILQKKCAWLLPMNLDKACRVRGEWWGMQHSW